MTTKARTRVVIKKKKRKRKKGIEINKLELSLTARGSEEKLWLTMNMLPGLIHSLRHFGKRQPEY